MGHKGSCYDLCHSVLPMFSSKSFTASGLTIRSLIHLEFIFVYGARKYSNFIPLYVATQFSHTTYWRDGHYFFSSHLSESTYFHKRHHPASFIFLVVFLYIIYICVCVCVCFSFSWEPSLTIINLWNWKNCLKIIKISRFFLLLILTFRSPSHNFREPIYY